MYIPKHFTGSDKAEMLAFMREFSFATLVTAENGMPVATHLPFIIETRGDDIVLRSHLAAVNPQRAHLTGAGKLVIFSEPHAYVSPKHYSKELNVPTWNYLAVHAYGNATLITEPDAVFQLLETMIAVYERDYLAQWQRLPADYKKNMAKGIAAFEIRVEQTQFKKKLSQNKTTEERQRIADAFEKSNFASERLISRFMQNTL